MDVLKNCNFLDGVVRQSGGEWASPRAARRHKRCGETKSHVQGGRGSFWLQGEEREYGISRTPRDNNEVGSVVASYILLLVYSNSKFTTHYWIIHDKICSCT